ncbi:MAG: hypothetical protein ACKO2G_12940 [Verrucomicrobiales bacterium]
MKLFRRLLIAVTASLPLFLASCGGCGGNMNSLPANESASLGACAPIVAQGAANAVAYKGLAHPRKDFILYQKQVKTVPHVEYGDFLFHREPVAVPADGLKQVAAIYTDESNHRARRKVKPCPGFHPDWVLVWQSSGRQWLLQICYGCHEWKLIGPNGTLYTDISDSAYPALKSILPR